MKPFLIRSLLFVALLLGVQATVALAYPARIPSEILAFEALLREGVDVLYLGDSTLWYPRGDSTTPQILQTLLPQQQVGEISHAAYGFEVYRAYAEELAQQLQDDETLQPPTWVVLPINMRSFSPEWNLRPGYQFVEEQTVLRLGVPLARFVARPLDIFGGFDSDITEADFLATTVYSNTTPVGSVADFEALTGVSALDALPDEGDAQEDDEQGGEAFAYYAGAPAENDLDEVLTYYYMNALDPNQRKLTAMVETVETLRAQNIQVLLYITPVNVDLGDAYIGPAFRAQFARNVEVVREKLLASFEEPPLLLDLSTALEAFTFVDTEHLTPRGKLFVAQQIADAIAPAADPAQGEVAPGQGELEPTPSATPVPDADATPMPPLLATQLARLTPTAERDYEATESGSSATATSTPNGDDSGVEEGGPENSVVASPTPVQNPLLATTLARATRQPAATPTP